MAEKSDQVYALIITAENASGQQALDMKRAVWREESI